MHLEFENITDMLLTNIYSLATIQSQIRNFFNRKYQTNKTSNSNGPTSTTYTPRIFLIGNTSIQLEK